MSRKNCFVKISGDTLGDDVLSWIKELSQEYFVVVCVGGGTQINSAFAAAGLPVREFGPLGRETVNTKEKQLAMDVLRENQAEVRHRLADLGVHASVIIPVIEVCSVPCHVNGDQFILAVYHGFDVLYVVTTNDRFKEKKAFFAPYEKIQVIGF